LWRKLQPTVMLTVDHKQSLQLEVRFGGICSHQTAACALVPHLSGAFLSVTARAGAARIAQQRGGKGQVPEVLLLLLDECDTLGCEREFSLLASVTRGSKRADGGVEE